MKKYLLITLLFIGCINSGSEIGNPLDDKDSTKTDSTRMFEEDSIFIPVKIEVANGK